MTALPIVTMVDVRDRVMQLCELIALPSPYTPGTAYRNLSECSWSDDQMSAYVVEALGRGSQYEYTDSVTSYLTRDTIRITLYLNHICDESYSKDWDNIDLAERAKAYVVHFFVARPTLVFEGDQLVELGRINVASAPRTAETTGSIPKHRSIIFVMPVEFRNFSRQTE